MAHTTIPTGDALSPKIVQKLMFKDTIKNSFFSRFFSSAGDNLVYEKTDFLKAKGDTMTFGLRPRFVGDGVTGNATMKGKEGSLSFLNMSLTLERYRQAIKDDGQLTRQRFVGDIPTETRASLVDWGSEKIDQLAMDALVDSPTKILYGGTATAIGNLVAGSKITPALISKVKAQALTQRATGETPIVPIKINGQKHLVLLVSNDVAYDLKIDSTYAQANREAQVRGASNPLFTGALGVWDNVIIFEHENVPVLSNGGSGSNVPYSKNILMGARALCLAWGERPSIVEESDDYEEFMGYCWRMTMAIQKSKFDSKDFGSIAIYTSDSRPTGRTVNYK